MYVDSKILVVLVMKMDLRELLLVFSMLWSMTTTLRCYKCMPQKDTYSSVPVCEHFDYSEKYMVECADSTMCYKKEISASLGDGFKLFERDCAKQIMNGDQEKDRNGHWVSVRKIYETIEEGCKEESPNGKVTRTVHCYCRGDLCNSAINNRSNFMHVQSKDIKSLPCLVMLLGTIIVTYLVQ